MQLRIPLNDLYAAPAFLTRGATAPVSNAARISQLYSFLSADTSVALDSESLVVARTQQGGVAWPCVVYLKAAIAQAASRAVLRQGDVFTLSRSSFS